MSVTVTVVPFLLINPAIATFTAAALFIPGVVEALRSGNKSPDLYKLHLDSELAETIFSKKYDTMIMDKDTLIKTLEEHGANNIEIKDNDIFCYMDNLQLVFNKTNDEEPYKLSINYNEESDTDELVQNIGSEYTLNAQEISYNKIKDRLNQKNLKIESEEVYDDNTIVLTVNLE